MSYFDILAAKAGAGGGTPTPPPVLIEKSVTQNGTYTASSDEADGYSSVAVNVPNTYAAGDEGKVVSNGALVAQTSTTATTNGTINTTTNNSVTVNVPNTYTAGDEGKVVSNGALVAQGSDTVTQNGTVDTTLINSLLVNVSGGSGSATKLSGEKAIDAYIMQTDEYVYIFGCVYPSGYRKITLPIPNGFTLGTFIYGASFQQYATPSYSSYLTYGLSSASISNNEVEFRQSTDYQTTSANTWMIAVFNISARTPI